jgi:hypothetical protein
MKNVLLAVAVLAALSLGGCRLDIDDDDADDRVSLPPSEIPAWVDDRSEG